MRRRAAPRRATARRACRRGRRPGSTPTTCRSSSATIVSAKMLRTAFPRGTCCSRRTRAAVFGEATLDDLDDDPNLEHHKTKCEMAHHVLPGHARAPTPLLVNRRSWAAASAHFGFGCIRLCADDRALVHRDPRAGEPSADPARVHSWLMRAPRSGELRSSFVRRTPSPSSFRISLWTWPSCSISFSTHAGEAYPSHPVNIRCLSAQRT